MTIVVCLDDRNGMSFNKRRQSSDRELRKRLLTITEGKRLWMTAYSAKQFTEPEAQIEITKDFSEVTTGECVFVESTIPTELVGRAKYLVVYRWNRVYPSDTVFPLEAFIGNRTPSTVYEFAGYSHEKLTEEVYEL